jgi:hypothetical protein
MVSGLASGSGTRAPLWPILPSTDTSVVSVVLRVNVLRSTHNYRLGGGSESSRFPLALALAGRGPSEMTAAAAAAGGARAAAEGGHCGRQARTGSLSHWHLRTDSESEHHDRRLQFQSILMC